MSSVAAARQGHASALAPRVNGHASRSSLNGSFGGTVLTGSLLRPAGSRVQNRGVLRVQAVIEKIRDAEPALIRSINNKSVLALVLGGGSGDKLFPLTYRRSEPAISFGGAYRLIDVPLSNAINSGVEKVYVLTQTNSQSLNRHVSRAFNMGSVGVESFIEILAATQTIKGTSWFGGTADAIRQFLWLLEDTKNRGTEHVIILAADQLYRMDYMRMVVHHINSGADVTVACTRVGEERAHELGLIKFEAGGSGRITEFAEKPTGQRLQDMRFPLTGEEEQMMEYEEDAEGGVSGVDLGGGARPYMASMGIYCFSRKRLVELLKGQFSEAKDLGRDILPAMVAGGSKVYAYEHAGYWEDVGSVQKLFEANLEIAADSNNFNLFDPKSPLYTSQRYLPPAKLSKCSISEAMIGNGSVLERCTVRHAVVGVRSRIGVGSVVEDAVVSGNDFYESAELRQRLLDTGRVPMGIGPDCTITNTIVDKNCRIGKGCVLVNKDGVQEADREEEGWYIRDGIVVVIKDTVIPAFTTI